MSMHEPRNVGACRPHIADYLPHSLYHHATALYLSLSHTHTHTHTHTHASQET